MTNLNPDEKLPEARKAAKVQQAGFHIIASLPFSNAQPDWPIKVFNSLRKSLSLTVICSSLTSPFMAASGERTIMCDLNLHIITPNFW